MMPAELLLRAGQEPRHVLEGDQRDVEGVAEADEAGALERGVDVEDPGEVGRLVGDHADAAPAEPGEADHQVPRVGGVDLEEPAVVDHPADQLLDVVGLVRVGRDQLVERLVLAVGRVVAGHRRRVVDVVRRQVGEQLADGARQAASLGRVKCADAALRGVGRGAAQLLLRHLLVGDGADDVGPVTNM
jgi:hypothetical protein